MIVVHHTVCGLVHTSNDSIRTKLKETAPGKANQVDGTGFDLFKDLHQSVRPDRGVIKACPYLNVQRLGLI